MTWEKHTVPHRTNEEQKRSKSKEEEEISEKSLWLGFGSQ